MEVKKNVHYIGVNDRHKALFENLWPLPYGVSYNSYLIVDEKVTLVDTVDVNYSDLFLKKIRNVIGDRPIDYLVVNHMEPDHSGSIPFMLAHYPEMTVVGNKKTFEIMDGFFELDCQRLVIGEGDKLPIGERTLEFYLIPMVHWPETMVTYDRQDKVLFSGDAFGSFGALNGACVDKYMNTDMYWSEMCRYYSNIVGKFGGPVQKALKKLKGLDFETICSTHGPVWEAEIQKVVQLYDKWSRYEAEEGVVIAYGSMYGNTEELAECIAEELSLQGIRNVVVHDVSKTDHSFILADIFRYKGFIAGCTTYNTYLFPQMEGLLTKVVARDMKNRYMGYFGSFTWASAAYKRIGEFAQKLNFEQVGTPIEMKQAMTKETVESVKELAKAMAERLKADR